MHGFTTGRRWAVSVASLLLALVLTMAWLRSLDAKKEISIYFRGWRSSVYSTEGSLYWMTWNSNVQGIRIRRTELPPMGERDTLERFYPTEFGREPIPTQIAIFLEVPPSPKLTYVRRKVVYWQLIFPLILLSTYMLLRQRKNSIRQSRKQA